MVFTFANGVEIYSEDNSVGINVTQPRRTFDINGDLGVSRNIFIGTSINDSNNLGKICINTTDTSISFYNNSNDGMVIPVGNITQRVGITGTIRYNTDTLSFEGYDGTNWGSLGGVKDVDQDTYISAESNPGSDNDELKFYTGGNERMFIGSTGNIGIGTDNPINGKLEIVGSDGLVSLDYESYTSITPTRIQTGVTATNSYSIYADGKIAAAAPAVVISGS